MFRIAIPALLCATPAFADIRVDFDEGAPKDRFTIQNVGACALDEATVTVDLSGSSGKLIFDVTGSGAGIEVFQPFEAVSGAELLTALPSVSDGDTAVSLTLRSLAPGERIAFTIDVDDTTSSYGIIVSGSEITGAVARVERSGAEAEGRFGADAVAHVTLPTCIS